MKPGSPSLPISVGFISCLSCSMPTDQFYQLITKACHADQQTVPPPQLTFSLASSWISRGASEWVSLIPFPSDLPTHLLQAVTAFYDTGNCIDENLSSRMARQVTVKLFGDGHVYMTREEPPSGGDIYLGVWLLAVVSGS